MKRTALGLLAVVAILIAGGMLAMSAMINTPKEGHEILPVDRLNPKLQHTVGSKHAAMKVMSWNIQYGVGQHNDIGNLRTKEQVLQNLKGIVETINQQDPDILFLQEVDFASFRTSFIDEYEYISSHCPQFGWAAKVVTWDVSYLPYPAWPITQHYRRMKSGQVLFSKFPILRHEAYYLPQPKANSAIYNRFYLRRTVQKMVIEASCCSELTVFNVHLEAFDQPNREEQARILNKLLQVAESEGGGFVIAAGDFNAIPKQAKLRANFPDEPETDMTTDRTIEILTHGTTLADALFEFLHKYDGKELFTYPSVAPNRRLDYIFKSSKFHTQTAYKVANSDKYSDHVAIAAVLLPQNSNQPQGADHESKKK